VRVLVITAHSDPATTSFALKCGADLCLPKPFDLTDLWQAAHQLLALPTDGAGLSASRRGTP
jgi:DNA-binding NarL/FixJ family response regulator